MPKQDNKMPNMSESPKRMKEIEDVFDNIDNYQAGLPLIKKLDNAGKIIEVREVASNYTYNEREEPATIEEYKNWTKKILADKFINEFKNQASFTIKIDNYIENAYQFYKHQPFFYDKIGLFWFWNFSDKKYVCVDDVDVMNKLDRVLGFNGQTVSRSVKCNYLEAMKRVGRLKQPKPAPKKWIQFKDKAYSLGSGQVYVVTPDYFFTNPIPWELGKSTETPVIDKLLEEWCGVKGKQTLLEILAYSCYTDYPLQTIICLHGCGRNGKGQFMKLLTKFVGKENICSSELDTLINSRFEAFKLYKQLICSMGETNFGILNKTSLLKKLVGGDMIGFEKKGKDPFDDFNYAKIIISSNSLPTSADESDGFFRRWNIVDFPNEFSEGKDIIKSIPDVEFNNLAKRVIEVLPVLLECGKFTDQGSILERREKYMLASNPLPIFIRQCCIKEDTEYVSYNQLYTAYVKFLLHNKKRRVKMGEFKQALETDGFWIERTSKADDEGLFRSGNWVVGLNLKKNYADCVNYEPVSTPLSYIGSGVESDTQSTQSAQEKPEIIDFLDDFP